MVDLAPSTMVLVVLLPVSPGHLLKDGFVGPYSKGQELAGGGTS